MNFNDIIASVAIGFVQMYDKLQKSEEVGEESRDILIMGVTTTALWLTYQYRKFGLNMLTINTSVALAVQIYVLNRIVKNKMIWFKG
mgnify:CR=1 FL=1